jgi:hypothetical protein
MNQTTTINCYGFPMEVIAEVDPGEPAILWPTDDAHPGSAPYAAVEAVSVGGVNIYDLSLIHI